MSKLTDAIGDAFGYWGETERALVHDVEELEAEAAHLRKLTANILLRMKDLEQMVADLGTELDAVRAANEQLTDQIVRGEPLPLDGPDLPQEDEEPPEVPEQGVPGTAPELSDEVRGPAPVCTGQYWNDGFSMESFLVHDEFTYCPVHDKKR